MSSYCLGFFLKGCCSWSHLYSGVALPCGESSAIPKFDSKILIARLWTSNALQKGSQNLTYGFCLGFSTKNGGPKVEYLGFDPSTSCLLSTHASNCANTRNCENIFLSMPTRVLLLSLNHHPCGASGVLPKCWPWVRGTTVA